MERTANLLGALGAALADETERVISQSVRLPMADAAALNVVGQNPGVSISGVSTALAVTHPGAVRVVDRLAAAGLVERRAGVDGRTVGLHFTPDGKALWQRQVRARGRFLDQLVAGLDRDSQRTLATVVEQLLTALTRDDAQAEHLCRLCDERACPQRECPVTIATET